MEVTGDKLQIFCDLHVWLLVSNKIVCYGAFIIIVMLIQLSTFIRIGLAIWWIFMPGIPTVDI